MEEIKGLEQVVDNLIMEFTQNDIEQKVADVDKKVSTFEITRSETYDYQINPNFVIDKLSELQNKKISEM